MRNKDLFLKALRTMLYSWGGDTPAEVHWALDEFVQFYEAETGEQLDLPEYDEEGEWATAVLTAMGDTGEDEDEDEDDDFLDDPENEDPNDMEPDDRGLNEELKRIKRLL